MPRQAYVFAQILNLLPWYDFQSIVNKYKGDYYIRHFKCWNQLFCMIFAHIQDRTLVFLTNNFILPVTSIAALYKARWEIEVFFKGIKQNLRVKTFYGTSQNAVKTQIWIDMIVYLLLAILKERHYLEPSLSKLLHFLEVNLF